MTTTSQTARKLITLLAQMKDAERGKRIKGLREGTSPERRRPAPVDRKVPQPRMIRDIEEMAGLEHFVSLRGLQYWEETGGIDPEKCDLIARYFGVDPRWLFYGPDRTAPDLTAVLNGNGPSEVDVEVLARLERLEGMLQQVLDRLPATTEPGDESAETPSVGGGLDELAPPGSDEEQPDEADGRTRNGRQGRPRN